MTVNPLPPQAYTKETLQRAYAWLLTQTPSVKEMATSQEMLVSMYLKAQRDGDQVLETPSIQNFKQELKSLASMMGEFQPANAPAKNAHTNSQPNMPVNAQQSASTQQASYNLKNNMPQSFAASAPPAGHSVSLTLDDQSLMAIQEVKRILNLSSDSEALRALISLGYKQFQKI
jgi:hypothetical protein